MNNTIPVHQLKMDDLIDEQSYEEVVLDNELEGLEIFHEAYVGAGDFRIVCKTDHATFLLVLKGTGQLLIEMGQQVLEPESLVLFPKGVQEANLVLAEGEQVHFLKFVKKYSAADLKELSSQDQQFEDLYFRRFRDCAPYSEKIKSPNTISRTILSGGIIPRVALGTVEANGPDRVGAHSHPMLEQIFLGLSDNDIKVYADDACAEMKAFSILHIPLGSTHWVDVAENCKMKYMWMDFFLTKDGEAWLDTHDPIEENCRDSNTL